MTKSRGVLHIVQCSLLCVAMFFLSLKNAVSHDASLAFAAPGEIQAAMDHDHAHDADPDIYWEMHGHSKDAVDHDHNPVVFTRTHSARTPDYTSGRWPVVATAGYVAPVFDTDRPPQV